MRKDYIEKMRQFANKLDQLGYYKLADLIDRTMGWEPETGVPAEMDPSLEGYQEMDQGSLDALLKLVRYKAGPKSGNLPLEHVGIPPKAIKDLMDKGYVEILDDQGRFTITDLGISQIAKAKQLGKI